jgi:hypothetical protein
LGDVFAIPPDLLRDRNAGPPCYLKQVESL